MVNLLVVKGFENGTKNFTNLHVFKADKISRNGEQFSTLALRTLHKPFITPGLLPTGFNNFLFFVILLDSTSLIIVLFLFDSKIQ